MVPHATWNSPEDGAGERGRPSLFLVKNGWKLDSLLAGQNPTFTHFLHYGSTCIIIFSYLVNDQRPLMSETGYLNLKWDSFKSFCFWLGKRDYGITVLKWAGKETQCSNIALKVAIHSPLTLAPLTGCSTSSHHSIPCTFSPAMPGTLSRTNWSMPFGRNQWSWVPNRSWSCGDVEHLNNRLTCLMLVTEKYELLHHCIIQGWRYFLGQGSVCFVLKFALHPFSPLSLWSANFKTKPLTQEITWSLYYAVWAQGHSYISLDTKLQTFVDMDFKVAQSPAVDILGGGQHQQCCVDLVTYSPTLASNFQIKFWKKAVS